MTNKQILGEGANDQSREGYLASLSPEVSDSYDARRRSLLDHLYARRHELANRLVDEFCRVMPEYEKLSEAVLRDVAEMSVHNIEDVASTFADGFNSVDDIEWLRRSAARRVHQHVSLASLLRTYRLAGTLLWRTIAEESGEDPIGRQVAIDCADAMMRYTDSVSSAISQAYLRESASVISDGQALRTDVLETVLSGEPVSEAARRQAAALAMTLRDRPLFVVLLHVRDLEDALVGVPAAVRRMRDQLGSGISTTFVGTLDADVVAICCPNGEIVHRDLEGACQRLLDTTAGWTVGLGRLAEGISGVRRSYEEAREAIELGLAAGWSDRVVRFADVLLDQILRSTQHLDTLLEETVQPLADYDSIKGADLVPTLRAYVAQNFNVTKAAATLRISPNTVVYRLRRIHEISHRDPAVSDDLLLLALGLRLLDSAPFGPR